MGFNSVEYTIIREMQEKSGWRTTNELAELAQVAWETADKALKSLYKKGYLVKGKKKQRIYWRLY